VQALDLAAVGTLSFEAPDEQTFSCLRLARQAGMQGGTAPCVLNAADEVAVAAFLAGELAFTGIAEVVERTLDAVPSRPVGHFSDLYEADASARRRAAEICEGARA
jgi:1-deoxy-D-xylulose-5-phosphate reductoisomerase